MPFFKKKKIYFFLKERYPENLFLAPQFIWKKSEKRPFVKKPLSVTIHRVKKVKIKKYQLQTFFQKKSLAHTLPKLFNKYNKYNYPQKNLFVYTRAQATRRLCTPKANYRKITEYFQKIKERKKFKILWGIDKQKKLIQRIRRNDKISYSICERKINVLFYKTGYFNNIRKVSNAMRQSQILYNNRKIKTQHIQWKHGDTFAIPYQINPQISKMYNKLKRRFKRIKYKKIMNEKFVTQMKIYFLFRKILFYRKKHKKK